MTKTVKTHNILYCRYIIIIRIRTINLDKNDKLDPYQFQYGIYDRNSHCY